MHNYSQSYNEHFSKKKFSMTSLFFWWRHHSKNFPGKNKKFQKYFFCLFYHRKRNFSKKSFFFWFFWSDHLLENYPMPKMSTLFSKNYFVSMLQIEFPLTLFTPGFWGVGLKPGGGVQCTTLWYLKKYLSVLLETWS